MLKSFSSIRYLIVALGIMPFLVFAWRDHYDDIYLTAKALWLYCVILPISLWIILKNRSALDISELALKLMLFFGGWLIIASLVVDWKYNIAGSFDRQDGLLAHIAYLCVSLAIFLSVRINPDSTLKNLSCMLVCVGTLLGGFIGLQVFGVLGIIGGDGLSGVAASIAGATLGNRGYAGGLLALCLPFVLAGVCRYPRTWPILFLVAFALSATWTRGVWIAGLVGWIGWMLLSRSWKHVRFYFPVALGITLALLIPKIPNSEIPRAFNAGMTDNSQRIVLYKSALVGIQQKPWFGWRADGVIAAMHARPVSDVLNDMGKEISSDQSVSVITNQNSDHWIAIISDKFSASDKTHYVSQEVNKVHNEYLDYGVSYGIPAMLGFIALMLVGFLRGRLVPALSAALLAYAGYLLTWPEVVRFAPVAWAILGGALAMRVSTHRAAATVQPCPSPPSKNGTPSPGSSQEAASHS